MAVMDFPRMMTELQSGEFGRGFPDCVFPHATFVHILGGVTEQPKHKAKAHRGKNEMTKENQKNNDNKSANQKDGGGKRVEAK